MSEATRGAIRRRIRHARKHFYALAIGMVECRIGHVRH